VSRGTRLTWAAWAVVLLICAVVFGLWPKEIHIAECGSVLDPAKTVDMIHEAKQECGFALGKRATVMWGLVVLAAGFALVASLGGALFPPRPPRHREDVRVG
jgi:hypothetical protein